MLTQLLIICPLVFLAGFVDSIAGGGGIISLPAYLLAGLPAHSALGTNKFSSTFGTGLSTARFIRNGYLKGYERPVIFAAGFSLIGSAAGSNLALLIPDYVITGLMLVVLPVVAFFVLRKKSLEADSKKAPRTEKQILLITCAVALLIGCYDGLYGPGTGTFLILLLTGIARMQLREASAFTKVLNLTSNVAALTVFIMNGTPLYALGIPAALCGIAGNYLGSGLVVKDGTKIVRPIILVVLVLLFIKVLFGF